MLAEQTKRVVKCVLLATVAAVFGAGLYEVVIARTIRGRHGLHRVGPNAGFKAPESLNDVEEICFDSNDDGRADEWWVYIRPDQRYQGFYSLTDVDFDGSPDEWGMQIGLGKTAMVVFDRDNDGVQDAVGLVLQSRYDEKEWYNYQDFNLDGKLDEMSRIFEGKVIAGYVLMNDCWVRAGRDERDGSRKTWIRSQDSELFEVVFEGGHWVVSGAGEH